MSSPDKTQFLKALDIIRAKHDRGEIDISITDTESILWAAHHGVGCDLCPIAQTLSREKTHTAALAILREYAPETLPPEELHTAAPEVIPVTPKAVTPETLTWRQFHDLLRGPEGNLRDIAQETMAAVLHYDRANYDRLVRELCTAINNTGNGTTS